MAKFEIKHNVLFFPDKEGNEKTGYKPDAKLRIRIRWAKNVINFNVGYRVELTKWSTETQRCNTGTSHGRKKVTAKDINSEIQSLEDIIEAIFTAFELKQAIPSVDDFRGEYTKKTNRSTNKTAEVDKTIFNYFDEFILKESISNNWKYATLQKFATVKNHLTAFDNKLTFEKLAKDGLNNYVVFLRDNKDMRNSTVLKQIAFLKWFLKWSSGEGYNTNLAFSNFLPKMDTVDKKVIFLDWNELMIVYNFDFRTAKKKLRDEKGNILLDSTGQVQEVELTEENKKALEKVRDCFCFSCFTSLRYSDVANLKRSDINNNEIVVTTIKTSDSLTINLNNYSRAILAKYANEVYSGNKALPAISNQKMNDHLKEVGELCGLDALITITYFKGSERIDEIYPKYELLSTHAGRRTFICNALALGIAPQTVMKFTGHSNYKSMQPYIDVADVEKRKAMDLFNR